jgi:hypothetical protein
MADADDNQAAMVQAGAAAAVHQVEAYDRSSCWSWVLPEWQGYGYGRLPGSAGSSVRKWRVLGCSSVISGCWVGSQRPDPGGYSCTKQAVVPAGGLDKDARLIQSRLVQMTEIAARPRLKLGLGLGLP